MVVLKFLIKVGLVVKYCRFKYVKQTCLNRFNCVLEPCLYKAGATDRKVCVDTKNIKDIAYQISEEEMQLEDIHGYMAIGKQTKVITLKNT